MDKSDFRSLVPFNLENHEMSAERKCALTLGLIFTIIGIAGFVPAFVTLPGITAASAPINPDQISTGASDSVAYLRGFGYLFGLFPTNLLHNIVRLGVGLAGLFYAMGDRGAYNYNRFFAVSYLGLALLGLIPGANTLFGIMPIFGNNVWFNALTGAIAAYYAFVWHKSESSLSSEV
jgi:hypothetical protein